MNETDQRRHAPQPENDLSPEALGEAMGQFAQVAQSTAMPLIVTDAARSGDPVVFVNDAFLRLTKYARNEVIGRPFGAFVLDHQAISREWFSPDSELIQEGRAELACLRKDGSTVLVSVFSGLSLAAAEAAYLYVSTFVPTERAATLVDERARLRLSLYDNAPGIIATTEGRVHRYTYANKSYLRFVGKESVTGRTVEEVLPEMRDQGVLDLLDNVFLSGEPFIGKGVRIDFDTGKNGQTETRYLDFVYQPVFDDLGRVTGIFLEGHDITSYILALEEQKALESQLIHYSRLSAMGTMAATLAHEIQQPLAAIANYAVACLHLMSSRLDHDQASIREGIEGIVDASGRARDIIRKLKHMIARGRPKDVPMELGSAVCEAVRLGSAEACEGTDIQCRCPPSLIVEGDRVQVQQVVINLVRNACEAVAQAAVKRVTVTVAQEGAEAVVSIEDTGPGIPPEIERTLFQWSDSSKEEGMGIGLAIARSIIEAHGGRIWHNRGSGPSTRISFAIPLELEGAYGSAQSR